MKRLATSIALAMAIVACLCAAPAYASELAAGSADLTASTAVTAQSAASAKAATPTVAYRAHIQNIGWEKTWKKNGAMSGTKGRSLRLEGVKIKLQKASGGIMYRTHVQRIGWEKTWKKNGAMSGTKGRSYRLEAIQIKLTGAVAKQYDVYYRTYCQRIGWTGWARNGAKAGSQGFGYRMEALQVKLVAKGGKAPGSTSKAFRNKAGYLSGVPNGESRVLYRTHVQNVGWQNYMRDGQTAGTSGRSLRLEGINLKLGGAIKGGIEYRTHIQNIGWETNWKSNGAMSGTSGLGLRLEAIQIMLTGKAADSYDVYYRVHAQNFGWMGWTKNGERAGTTGYGLRLEAIQVKVVPKGAAAPGSTANAYASRGSEIGDKVVRIAEAEYAAGVQAGDYHKGGKKYWSAFKSKFEAWCSEFVGWCMQQAGLVRGVNMPYNPSYANAYVNFYRQHPELGTVHVNDGSYMPEKGDICIHVDGSGSPSHTELCVEGYRDGVYTTVSGNLSNKVQRPTRPFPNGGVGYYISLKD